MTQQVFISYSNESHIDRQVADKIYDALKARGIPCWVAHRDITAGQNWPDAISKAISNSRVMIVVLSEHTQKSSYVEMEVTQAADEHLTIIPFCIEKVSLSGGLKLLLSNCQWINAYPNLHDKDLDRLVETLQRRLGIQPREIFKKMVEKQLEVDQESPGKKVVYSAKKPLWLKRFLVAVLIDIIVIAIFFYIIQLYNNKETAPEPPDFIWVLISKGWEVKKIGSASWEASYKNNDITMAYIPPGEFMMGADHGPDNEKPPHEVDLDGYWIGKYEVTFAQYDRYCEVTGKEKPDDRGWGREKRPVINISWGDAGAYCDWLSQKTGLTFKLPTEAQWEKAARGTGGFLYPWGNVFDKNKCNSFESGLNKTMPVGSYPSGKSPYRCMDMAGNVWEWCCDWYDKDYYKNSPDKNPQGPLEGTYRALRGGSWRNLSGNLHCASREKDELGHGWDYIGFRVVCVPPQS